nr:MAG TPA: protein of unknown function (DUF5565) [Caudoviricetes sp.]
MKKIPTLFERVYKNHKIVDILPNVTQGMEWVLQGKGVATLKVDGSCCAIINGEFYKRYDAKRGKPIPEGAIKCQEEPDPITGHLPCWVKVDENKPEDKWFIEAYKTTIESGKIETTNGGLASGKISEHREFVYPKLQDGTYEAIGVHFQGNPYNLHRDTIVKHGTITINVERTFDGIKKYLSEHYIEGIVFWLGGEPRCKIKRSDFGFDWGNKK